MRTRSVLVIIALVSALVTGCSAGTSQSPETPTPDETLSLADWASGPMSDFVSDASEFVSVYPRPLADCDAAQTYVDDARDADGPPDEAIAASWADAIDAFDDMLNACASSDHAALETRSDKFFDALAEVAAGLDDAGIDHDEL